MKHIGHECTNRISWYLQRNKLYESESVRHQNVYDIILVPLLCLMEISTLNYDMTYNGTIRKCFRIFRTRLGSFWYPKLVRVHDNSMPRAGRVIIRVWHTLGAVKKGHPMPKGTKMPISFFEFESRAFWSFTNYMTSLQY